MIENYINNNLEFCETMIKEYVDYAIEVAKDRAIPDVRDGLKPVHRRILFAMYELGLFPEKNYRKCARIVGDVLGKYHPHGDSSVYDALVRMAQDFKMNVPLIKGHGNFGSIDGDSPAAMRYTEAKMDIATNYMLNDIKKGVVEFRDNFDSTLKEPVVLPAFLPNLLINGTSGIAVGLNTNIPQHNPKEIIETILKYINNKDITINELLEVLHGPDFPTGGVIANKKDLLSLYENGKGCLKIRPKIEKENISYGKVNLIIKEIPYPLSGNKSKLIDNIVDAVNDRKIIEISDIRDESDKDDMRIVIELKKNANVDEVLDKLYTLAKLECKESYEFYVLKDNIPKRLNLKELIECYVDFQKEILIKKYTYLLNKSTIKFESLTGLYLARQNIDLILEVITGANNTKQVKSCLMQGITDDIKFKKIKSEKEARKFSFTENQVKAILDMKLEKLVRLELEILKNQLDDLNKEIIDYKDLLSSEKNIEKKLIDNLKELKKDFNYKRKTKIEDVETKKYEKKIEKMEVAVVLDKFNYIKTINPSYLNDKVNFKYSKVLMNTDTIRVFTNLCKSYKVKVNDIDFCKITDKGVTLERLCNMSKNEYSIFILDDNELINNDILIATKFGLIKKISGENLITTRKSINFGQLVNDDEVVEITLINKEKEDDEVLVLTHKGYVLKYNLSEVKLYKKNAKGDKSIQLIENDYVERTTLSSKYSTNEFRGISLENIKLTHRNKLGKSLF